MADYTLLLVDDHAIVREGITSAIRTIETIEVLDSLEDGLQLFEFLEHTIPDCLLVDITMPHFDPIADIKKIRTNYPNMKILVVSAYDDDVYVQGLLRIGVDGYHLKDQPLEDLRLAIVRILSGERWVSSRIVHKLTQQNNQPVLPDITTRQRDILRLLYQGMDNRSIANDLNLSVKTVENHLTRLYRKLGVASRLEAVNYLMQHTHFLATHDSEHERPENPKAHVESGDNILLVDDNQRYRQQLAKMLHSITPNLLIYEASNIQEARILATQLSPRMIIVDVVLGDESGIQCVRELRQISAKSKIILISAYPDSEFHKQGIEAGAIAFVDKKILDLHTLRQILDDFHHL
ncbi:MAG: response regulator transcription factor [Chloroflexota bacterium]